MRILKLHQYAPPRPPIQKEAGTAGDFVAVERWLRSGREPAHHVQGVQSNWREFLTQQRAVMA